MQVMSAAVGQDKYRTVTEEEEEEESLGEMSNVLFYKMASKRNPGHGRGRRDGRGRLPPPCRRPTPPPPSVTLAPLVTPLFGWSSEADYIDSGRKEKISCFTEEKARQLRMKTMETETFHDAMYHSHSVTLALPRSAHAHWHC